MPHEISALILKGTFDEAKATTYDLKPIPLGYDLTLFHIDHYYSACWQKKLGTTGVLETGDTEGLIFPSEYALNTIMADMSEEETPLFAIISTNYQGGFGYQAGFVYHGAARVDTGSGTINEALAHLGVQKTEVHDEFDTVGLSQIRHSPEYLEKYFDLADELEV